MSDLAVELLVLCEKVSLDDGGRAVLDRSFTVIERDRFPAELAMALYAEVWGAAHGTARVSAQIVDASGRIVAEHQPDGVALDAEGITLFALPFETVRVDAPGDLTVRLLADGSELARRRFRVTRPWSHSTSTGSL